MTYTIRLALPADADGVGRVHAQAWREAYRGIMSDEWIAKVSEDERIARWERILGEPNPATQWVAEADGKIVGFAGSGPARDDSPVRELELWSLYVLESHHRQGIATALADAAIGSHPASLWVVAQNTPAQAFYRRIGSEPDGTESIFEAWNVAELRMVR